MILKVHIESVVLVKHESFVSTLNPIYEHHVAQQRTNKCVNYLQHTTRIKPGLLQKQIVKQCLRGNSLIESECFKGSYLGINYRRAGLIVLFLRL